MELWKQSLWSMFRFVIVALPLLFISSPGLFGQTDSTSRKVLSGKIIDDSLAYVIPYAHLWNERTKMGTITNESGDFSIEAGSQDTVAFSALGYYGDIYVVPDTTMNQNIVVRLKPKKYAIDEVVVRRFGTYESFKYQVIHLELPKTKTDYLREHLKVSAATAAVEADRERAIKDKMKGFGLTTSLGGGINRDKERLEKLNNLKKREQIITQKFNRVLVGDITQLDGDELTTFIAYCNFSEDYLYETKLYAIIEAVYSKFNAYQPPTDTIPSIN
jgi:hypothetical protein